MSETEEELDFALIDAKDGAIVGIHSAMYGCADNIHNALVIARAQAEYLNRLLALQREIKEKYEPALIKNDRVEGEPMHGEDSPDEVGHREYKRLVDKDVDILWYS